MIHFTELFPQGWQGLFDPRFKRIGAGFDVATTTNNKSNPSAITINQVCNDINYFRLKLRFKSDDPDVAYRILTHIQGNLPHGLKIRKLCIDATSEKFFAVALKRRLRGCGIATELIDSSSAIEHMGERLNYKAYLGNRLCNAYADGKIATANERWIKDDTRQVYRTKGTFAADVDENGNHADGFDADKLAYHAVNSMSLAAHADNFSVGTQEASVRPGIKNPYIKKSGNRLYI